MRTIYTICLMLIVSAVANAQNEAALQAAFKTSYAHETKSDFTSAIEDLKGVYSETKSAHVIENELFYCQYHADNDPSIHCNAVDIAFSGFIDPPSDQALSNTLRSILACRLESVC